MKRTDKLAAATFALVFATLTALGVSAQATTITVANASQWPADWTNVQSITLAADITLGLNDPFPDLITAVVDGNGHTLTLAGRALCATLGAQAELRNLHIKLTLDGPDANPADGGVATTNKGRIVNCLITGSPQPLVVTVVDGQPARAGGIVADNQGSITACRVAINTQLSLKQVATALPTSLDVGMIAGRNTGRVADCLVACQANPERLTTPDMWTPAITITDSRLAGATTLAARAALAVADNQGELAHIVSWQDATTNVTGMPTNDTGLTFPLAETGLDKLTLLALGDADNGDQALRLFNDPTAWTFTTPDADTYRQPTPTLHHIDGLTAATDQATGQPAIDIDDAEGLTALFELLAGPQAELYQAATIQLPDNIDLTLPNTTLDELDPYDLPALPTIPYFNGTLRGGSISGLAVRTQGLFDRLGPNARIEGLVICNALVCIDHNNAQKAPDGTIYAPIIAREVADGAALIAIGFAGDVVVDPALANETIAPCLVDILPPTAQINGFLFADDVTANTSNKACITIKQNLGTGRNKPGGGQQKVATNQKTANKALAIDAHASASDANESLRVFPDEAFASGAVAYWLNYDGQGYSGPYRPRWSQGARQPAPAINGMALYKVNYDTNNEPLIASAPIYANNGAAIRVAYSQKPAAITNGQAKIVLGALSAMWSFDASQTVSINFNKSAEHSTALPPAMPANDALDPGQDTPARRYSLTGQTLGADAHGLHILVQGGKARLAASK